MAKKKILVTFRTITPLWTGDAWQDNKEIRPSSLIGRLRFWFEVLMYFGGVLNKEDFNSKSGRFEKEVDREELRNFIQKNGNNIEEIIKHLLGEQKIPISSIIFGTTNWKSLIEIKEIELIEDYCFGNKLNLPNRICINKKTFEIKENDDCPKRRNNDWSVFFFKNPYFYGKIKVKFLVEENILNNVFYPLLTFMNKYGYWCGGWNIGYGRLRVESINNIEEWEKEEFNLQTFNISKVINFNKNEESEESKVLYIVDSFNTILNTDKKIKIFYRDVINIQNLSDEKKIKEIIKNLIKEKAQERVNFRNNVELRHKIFGTTKAPPNDKDLLPQGSKILPFIDEENGNLKGGFLSIAGLLNLEK